MSAFEGLRADIVWEANTGQAIADLGAVGEEYSRTTGAMSDQALRLAAAQDRLNASIQRSGPESRAAKTATLAYRQELAALAAEADAASAAVTKQAEAQARAANAASAAQLSNNVAAARSAGKALTTYVTTPTVIAAAVALKLGLNFEDSMRLIQTQAGATAGEVDRMSKGVLGLVHSGQSFGQTANDMAKGLFAIESEGVRGAKALQILRVAAAGAAVGQTDLAQTANALTSVMRVYGLDADQAAGAMATLNASVGAGKLHMEDLNAALATKFLPTARQLGITLPQALAALDVFTRAGIPANVAANNLTTSFIKMEAAAHGAAANALKQLGLSTTALADDLQRGGLPAALGDLVRGYDQLEKSGGKVAANQAIFASFGGSRSGAPILALVQQYKSYLQGLDQGQKKANPGTFWNDVAATMNLPSQKIREDVAKITADFVKVGVVIAPIAADIAGDVEEIASAFGHLPGPAKDAAGVLLLLFAAAGPLARGIIGTRTLIEWLARSFKTLPAEAGPAIAATDAELRTIGTTAATAGAEADTAIGSIGAAADRSAVQLGVLAGAEAEVGTAAVAAGAEAETAFAGIGAAAAAALGPVSALLAAAGATYGLTKVVHWAGQGITSAGNLASGSGVTGTGHGRGNGDPTNPATWSSWAKASWIVQHGGPHNAQWYVDHPAEADAFIKKHYRPTKAEIQAHDAIHPGHPYRRRHHHHHGAAGGGGGGGRGGGGGGGGGSTTTIPLNLQIRLQEAENAHNVAAERRILEQEKAFLEHELQRAKTKKQRLAALQAIGAVDAQIAALNTRSGTASRDKHAQADQGRESKLEARISNAQAAEQSARTLKAEKAAYERERKARLQLLALYEREAHDPALSASQRGAAERNAAKERKQIAAMSDRSREDQVKLAVLEAQNAVAKATVGSAAYDRAVKAEDKALAAEIAFYDRRAHNARLSVAARKKALEEELAARKQKAALDKQGATSAAGGRAEQQQVLAAIADIISKFGGNSTPIGGGRTDTHLYELVHESRTSNRHLSRIASTGRFPASDQQAAAAVAV